MSPCVCVCKGGFLCSVCQSLFVCLLVHLMLRQTHAHTHTQACLACIHMCIWLFAVCVCKATCTYSSVCASVCVCECYLGACFCLLPPSPLPPAVAAPAAAAAAVLLLCRWRALRSPGPSRLHPPLIVRSLPLLSLLPLTPSSPSLCLCPLFLSSSWYPFFLRFILLSLPRTASVQARRGAGGESDALLGVLSSHWIVMAVILAVPGEGREEEGRREVKSRWNRVRHETEREGEENEIDGKRWENREFVKGMI